MKLLSIHLPSNKPLHFRRLVENLVNTAADPTCFEVVVKIDIGDDAMQQTIADIQRDIDINLRVVLSERFPSYFHTYIALDECLRASDPEYYFCWHVNDEILIETPHWDAVLARYIDIFPDRLFRLKVNPQKMFYNFANIRETCLYADYPIVPRRWLDAVETWAPCHGGDVFQEGISIYLAKYGHHRNIPLIDIVVGGDEAGNNLSPGATLARAQGTCPAWDDTLSAEMQQRMARAARRVQLFIRAHEHGLHDFELREDPARRLIDLVQDEHVYARVPYAIDQVALRFRNFDYIAQRNWPFSLWGKSPAYKAAVYTYRGVRRVAEVLLAVVKIPVGLAVGVSWQAVMASTIDPAWRSIQEQRLKSWMGNGRRSWRTLVRGVRRRAGGWRPAPDRLGTPGPT